jgi:hypothetical protein
MKELLRKYIKHTWQQCLLGSKLPCKLEKVAPIWSFIRGSVIWLCWIDRNAICFVKLR